MGLFKDLSTDFQNGSSDMYSSSSSSEGDNRTGEDSLSEETEETDSEGGGMDCGASRSGALRGGMGLAGKRTQRRLSTVCKYEGAGHVVMSSAGSFVSRKVGLFAA